MTTLEKIFSPLIGIGLTVVIIFIIVYLAFWISNKLSDDDWYKKPPWLGVIYYSWVVASLTFFFVAVNLSTEDKPKQPKANNATASTK